MSLYKKIIIEGNLKLKINRYPVDRNTITLVSKKIKPLIYYEWSKQKQQNQNLILLIGALAKYGNWSKKSFFIRFKKNEIYIFKKIEKKIENLKTFLYSHTYDYTPELVFFSYSGENYNSIFSIFQELSEIEERQREIEVIHRQLEEIQNERQRQARQNKREEVTEIVETTPGDFTTNDFNNFWNDYSHFFSNGTYTIVYSSEGIERVERFADVNGENDEIQSKSINSKETFKSDSCVLCMDENHKPTVLFCSYGHVCICDEFDEIYNGFNCPICRVKSEVKRKI